MKMKLILSVLIALLLSIISAGVVLSHGEPVITVQPAVAAPGSHITVIGSDMEDGEVFQITLEGMINTISLGEASAKQDGDEAGFTASFTLPTDLSTGSYLVQAATDEGETTTADLTVAASTQPMSMNTGSMQARAEPEVIDRTKPLVEVGSIAVLALLSAVAGIVIVRWQN